jgi:hypothetical protein
MYCMYHTLYCVSCVVEILSQPTPAVLGLPMMNAQTWRDQWRPKSAVPVIADTSTIRFALSQLKLS